MTETRSPIVTMTAGRSPTAAVHGEFEMAATFTVEPALERIARTPELDLVTLDLAGATFIDSVGLGVVNRLAGELKQRGVALRILPGPPEVQRVFETAGMLHALPFENHPPSTAEAPARRFA